MIYKKRWERLRAGHTAKKKVREHYFYVTPGSGNGDLLYNTCREIIDRDEQDCWSDDALHTVFYCLKAGYRWPDYMEEFIHTDLNKQYKMTQDPWLLAYCCAVYLGRYRFIRKYKPSWKLFNFPDKWAWRRALLGKPNLYWLWRIITPHTLLNMIRIKHKDGEKQGLLQDFVYVFYGYMDQAYKQAKFERKFY